MAALSSNTSSPFRATKLWNQLLSSFKEGMQLKRKRWRLKSYEQCFTGADALQWLYSYLQNHPSFGAHVTREQAFMLLQKFLDNNVFQAIAEKNHKKFQDTNHLYRFPEDIEKVNKDVKDDKENFNSRNSFTNLMRTISRINNKKLGDVNKGTTVLSVNQEINSNSVKQNKSTPLITNPLKSNDKYTLGFTPLASNLNQISLAGNNKLSPGLHYSDVSTILFQDEDERCDDVFETSISAHFLTRSNSLQSWKRDSRIISKPLGTFWEDEYNKTECKGITDTTESEQNIKPLEKKTEKKRTMLRNFGKTSLIKNNSIHGKRKSNGVKVDEITGPKLTMVSEKCEENSSSTNSTLPRKAVALLGENEYHIHEIESYGAYYPVGNSTSAMKEIPPLNSQCIKGLQELNNPILEDNNEYTKRGQISCQPIQIMDHKQSYFNPVISDEIDAMDFNFQLNTENSNAVSSPKIKIKKARSFSAITENKFNSPKLRKPAKRTHAMIRRSISQNNLRRRRARFRSKSTTDVKQSFLFDSCESIVDESRLYKIPSTWSIDTIGLMNDIEEVSSVKPPEITTEDVEETWKSVVILSLKKLFGIDSVRQLFDSSKVSGASIMNNIEWKPSEISRDAPEWLLSAMNCLIDWPDCSKNAEDSILQELPSYPGFERDVYRAIKEHYHTTLSKPLIPSHLYPLVQECADVLHDEKDVAIKILQHIILLLPCWNRRQIQLLIHFMNKVSSNELLQISKDLPNKDLVIHSFFRLIVRPEKQVYNMEEAVIPIRITNLLLDSHDTVFKAPACLRGQVDHKLAVMLGTPSASHAQGNQFQRPSSADDASSNNRMNRTRSFCVQITKVQYEKEAKENFKKALRDLLTTYINDKSLCQKERCKRLKQFQKAYPDIYAERFSCDDVSNCSTISQYSTNFKHAMKPSFLTEKLL